MKKLLVLVGLAAVGFVVYRQVVANKAEDDLWQEATAPADLTQPEAPLAEAPSSEASPEDN